MFFLDITEINTYKNHLQMKQNKHNTNQPRPINKKKTNLLDFWEQAASAVFEVNATTQQRRANWR